jgi:hypothetical protein
MIRLAIILTIVVILVAWDQSFALSSSEGVIAKDEAETLCLAKRAELPKRAFTTDACSLSPNGLGDNEWSKCCVEHDYVYWCGGTKEERKIADEALRTCVNAASTNTGDVFYYHVRVFGSKWIPAPWRWGYGDSYFDIF